MEILDCDNVTDVIACPVAGKIPVSPPPSAIPHWKYQNRILDPDGLFDFTVAIFSQEQTAGH